MSDYQCYYDSARSTYDNACYQMNKCENRLYELDRERKQTVNDINNYEKDLKKAGKALKDLKAVLKNESDLKRTLANVSTKTTQAASNFSSMISSSDSKSKDLSEVYREETTKTKQTLDQILSKLDEKKKILERKIEELEKDLKNAEQRLRDIKQDERNTKSDKGYWNGIKRSASNDMEYYRRKMREEAMSF